MSNVQVTTPRNTVEASAVVLPKKADRRREEAVIPKKAARPRERQEEKVGTEGDKEAIEGKEGKEVKDGKAGKDDKEGKKEEAKEAKDGKAVKDKGTDNKKEIEDTGKGKDGKEETEGQGKGKDAREEMEDDKGEEGHGQSGPGTWRGLERGYVETKNDNPQRIRRRRPRCRRNQMSK